VAPGCAFDSVQKQLQFFGTQAEADALARGPAECASFQTLRTKPKARPIPVQKPDPVAPFIGEDKQVAAKDLLMEDCLS
jgi:hypothetical protein